jgi:hypothetical protein
MDTSFLQTHPDVEHKEDLERGYHEKRNMITQVDARGRLQVVIE